MDYQSVGTSTASMRNNYPTKPPYKYTSIIFPTKTTSTPSLRTLGEMNGYSHGEVSDYTTDLSKVKKYSSTYSK